MRSDREDIDKHLKAKFKGHQTEKEALINEVEEMTEKIQRKNHELKNEEEEVGRLEQKTLEHARMADELDHRIGEVEQALKVEEEQHSKLREVSIQ
jgi:predicted nuclease with TOPRIM domain